MKRQGGWTLFELLIVIILVGILSVSYFARFFNLTDESHNQVNEKTLMDLRSALSMYEARAYLKGEQPFPDVLDDAAAGSASESNPFFSNVLNPPGVTDGWEKLNESTYRVLGGNKTTYQYNSATGKLNPID